MLGIAAIVIALVVGYYLLQRSRREARLIARAESLDEGNRAGVCCGALQAGLLEQKPRNDVVDDPQQQFRVMFDDRELGALHMHNPRDESASERTAEPKFPSSDASD